ncbi:MAG: hypothetical protein ABIV47_00565 [Roseiflexaceae bacterium]
MKVAATLQHNATILVGSLHDKYEVSVPFDNLTNPFQNPADVPAKYRTHSSIQKIFKRDGSGAYVRPAEDPVTIWTTIKLHEEYGAACCRIFDLKGFGSSTHWKY